MQTVEIITSELSEYCSIYLEAAQAFSAPDELVKLLVDYYKNIIKETSDCVRSDACYMRGCQAKAYMLFLARNYSKNYEEEWYVALSSIFDQHVFL